MARAESRRGLAVPLAALRPGCGRTLAKRRRRDQGDRTRRQLQRAEQTREAAADDDDVVGLADEILVLEILVLAGHGCFFRCCRVRDFPTPRYSLVALV